LHTARQASYSAIRRTYMQLGMPHTTRCRRPTVQSASDSVGHRRRRRWSREHYARRQLRQTFLPLSPFCPGGPWRTVSFLSIAPGPGRPFGPCRPLSPFCPRRPYVSLPFMPGNPGGPVTPCTCHQSQTSIQTKTYYWLAVSVVDQITHSHHLTNKQHNVKTQYYRTDGKPRSTHQCRCSHLRNFVAWSQRQVHLFWKFNDVFVSNHVCLLSTY